MKRKNFQVASLFLLIMFVLVISLTGCSSSDTSKQPAKEEPKAEEIKYPTSNVQIIVPYSAGGGTDTLARSILPILEEELGTKCIVVNRPGAGSEIGTTEMAKGKPDGYNLGFISYPDNVILETYKDTEYKSARDFRYLALFSDSPNGIVAPPNSPFKTMEEVIKYSKEHPGELTVSESGDIHIITTSLVENATGAKFTTINFNGGGDNLNAVIGGHVNLGCLTSNFWKTAVSQGAKPLAVAAEERLADFPDVPTFKELGFENVIAGSSRILLAPKDTPDEVVNILTDALNRMGANAKVKEAIENVNEIYVFKTGDELKKHTNVVDARMIEVTNKNKERFLNK